MSSPNVNTAFCRGCNRSFESVEALLDHDCEDSGTGPSNSDDDGPDGRPPLVADGGQSEMRALDRDSKIVTAVYTTDAPAENFTEMWAQSHYPSADRIEVYDRFEGRDVLIEGDRPSTRLCPACGEDAHGPRHVDGEQRYRHENENTECELALGDHSTTTNQTVQSDPSDNRIKRALSITAFVLLAGGVGYAVTPITSQAVSAMGAGSPGLTPVQGGLSLMSMAAVVGVIVFLIGEVMVRDS